MNNYFNPLYSNGQNSQYQSQNSRSNFDINQFRQAVQALDNNSLVWLVQQARAQGISDRDIEMGLNIIQKMK